MNTKRLSMPLPLKISALLLSLAGCTTVAPPQVIAPAPPPPEPPALLLSPPPVANFQTTLHNYFYPKPGEQTKPLSTPTPATSGSNK